MGSSGTTRWIDALIASQPSRAWAAAVNLARRGELLMHLGYTVGRRLQVLFSVLIGIVVAVLLWWSPFLSKVLEPYVVVLNSIPKVALGPIFIVWMGTNVDAIVAMAIAVSVIVTVMMVYTGFTEVDPNKVKLLRTFGASKLQYCKGGHTVQCACHDICTEGKCRVVARWHDCWRVSSVKGGFGLSDRLWRSSVQHEPGNEQCYTAVRSVGSPTTWFPVWRSR